MRGKTYEHVCTSLISAKVLKGLITNSIQDPW